MNTGGKTILVTGGTGFIGRHVVRELLERGIRTRVYAPHLPPGEPASGAEFAKGDIRDPAGLRDAMQGTGGVIHAAAAVSAWSSDPSSLRDVNVAGTRNVLRAALEAGGIPVVHLSSCSAIAFRGRGVSDEASIIPRTEHLTEYGMSKALAEAEVTLAMHEGLEAVIVYPTRVFGVGPLVDANAATKALDLYVRGKLRFYPGGGSAHANWGYVNDIAGGVVGALLRGRPGERYLLGGENIRLRDVFAMADEILGIRRTSVPIPAWFGRIVSMLEEHRAALLGTPPWITRTWYDALFEDTRISCAKAITQIGYSVTPARKALKSVLVWLSREAAYFPECPRRVVL